MELQRLIQLEVDEVDKELALAGGRAHPALTDDFFWSQVLPEMIGGEFTSAELRKRVETRGPKVDEDRFRTFLSRAQDRKLVEMRQRRGARPVWRLTEYALELTKMRAKEAK
jgi:hypothetical protein